MLQVSERPRCTTVDPINDGAPGDERRMFGRCKIVSVVRANLSLSRGGLHDDRYALQTSRCLEKLAVSREKSRRDG